LWIESHNALALFRERIFFANHLALPADFVFRVMEHFDSHRGWNSRRVARRPMFCQAADFQSKDGI
jgi:hypothetical protein